MILIDLLIGNSHRPYAVAIIIKRITDKEVGLQESFSFV